MALRADMSGNPSYRQVLQRVRKVLPHSRHAKHLLVFILHGLAAMPMKLSLHPSYCPNGGLHQHLDPEMPRTYSCPSLTGGAGGV